MKGSRMGSNYFMSDAFHRDAAKAVTEAVAKADALGLPKAHVPVSTVKPEDKEVVRLTTKKKTPSKATKVA